MVSIEELRAAYIRVAGTRHALAHAHTKEQIDAACSLLTKREEELRNLVAMSLKEHADAWREAEDILEKSR